MGGGYINEFENGKDDCTSWYDKNKYARAMEKLKSGQTTKRFNQPLGKSVELAQIRNRRTENQSPVSLDTSRVDARGGTVYFDGCSVSVNAYRFHNRYDWLK